MFCTAGSKNSAPPLILLTEGPFGLSLHLGSFQDPIQGPRTPSSCRRWLSAASPNSKQKRFKDATDAKVKLMEESSLSPQPDLFEFPPDQCIFCVSKKGLWEFRPRKRQRPDSLRCHLGDICLNCFPKGPVPCPREICNGHEFENVYA